MKAATENAPRKKLADITNVLQKEKSKYISICSKDRLEMLEKENVALMKLLAERNKIIEITGVEIHKMRIDLQQMQQQNNQLAQSNSRMLAELNSAKDRLRVLQHELGCANGLLRLKKLEAEKIAKQETCRQLNDEVKPIMCEEAGDSSLVNKDNDKPANIKRRHQSKSECKMQEIAKQEMCQQLNDKVEPSKCEEAGDSSLVNEDNDKPANIKRRHQSKSLGSSKQVQPLDKAENKRPCVRRQSARFKPEVVKLEEDYFEVEAKCPPMVNLVQENGSASSCMSPDDLERDPGLRFESKEFEKLSVSRPSRQAAKKVQSYKEIPVNIKMRRPA